MCCSSQGKGEVSHQPSMVSPAFVPIDRVLCQLLGGHRDRGDTDVKNPWNPSASSHSSKEAPGAAAPSSCRLCLGTVRCEIREAFSLSPTLLPRAGRDQRLLRLLDGAVSPGLPHPPPADTTLCHIKNPSPGGGFQISRGQRRFPAFTFPCVNSEVNRFDAAAWPWLLAPRGEVQQGQGLDKDRADETLSAARSVCKVLQRFLEAPVIERKKGKK